MANPRPHGVAVRGLSLAPSSPFFNGRFGRMFRALPPADFGANDTDSQAALLQLGAAMVSDEDAPKDGPNDEESGIPAAYTYLGQFIDHDLTFDPASSLQRQNDPDALIDFAHRDSTSTACTDEGPTTSPTSTPTDGSSCSATCSPATHWGRRWTPDDLARSSAAQTRAIIGDPRNDENVIVSQFQGLFLRFHNKVATDNPAMSFTDVQREVRFHYQWVVLNDFLSTVSLPRRAPPGAPPPSRELEHPSAPAAAGLLPLHQRHVHAARVLVGGPTGSGTRWSVPATGSTTTSGRLRSSPSPTCPGTRA